VTSGHRQAAPEHRSATKCSDWIRHPNSERTHRAEYRPVMSALSAAAAS
jgi:hypothetical protein